MKKIYFIFSIAVLVITACQQTPKPVSIDTAAEKAVIDSIFDTFNAAFDAKDVATLSSYLADDALCCGTDPSEFWTKQQITELWTQMLADSAPEINYINERKAKVAPDGKSAVVIEQYTMPLYTPKIPWRNIYYLVKTKDHWMIELLSSSFIPKNDDIPKLNKALE